MDIQLLTTKLHIPLGRPDLVPRPRLLQRLDESLRPGQETNMIKVVQLPRRQRIRKALQFISFLLLPATLYCFSPAIILQGASEGVVNGSMIFFGLLFLSSLLLGRLWRGWLCPTGGLQASCAPINNRRTGRINWIKWAIWIPWIGLIVTLAISAGGYRRVDPLGKPPAGPLRRYADRSQRDAARVLWTRSKTPAWTT
jgi:hypothetical protein